MRGRRLSVLFALLVMVGNVGLLAPAALADHTDPRNPQSSPTEGPALADGTYMTTGAGTWRHIYNSPANPGTDLEFFTKNGHVYGTHGTLGQGDEQHVGQRITRLVNSKGGVAPVWAADHGSANCPTANPSGTTGLQHDAQVTPKSDAQLIIDTTDATGRCHDSAGGGLELIDVSKLAFLQNSEFKPREVHLTRHAGTSHTVTVDATRPGVVYNSTSDFAGRNWIDVLDIRTCLGNTNKTLAEKRALCRPKVYRIPFQPNWSRQLQNDTPDPDDLEPGTEAACHDITAKGSRIYCAGLNATLIFDVSGLTTSGGAIKGQPLPCTVIDGTKTAAKVTDCSQTGEATQKAEGWRFLGTVNHPGRACPSNSVKTCNSNLAVRSDQGVAVAHEADPAPAAVGQYMFVTDERGGGVVPPGASCEPGIENPYGNGGLHAFRTGTPSNIQYARKPDGSKAVWIGDAVVPAADFCTIHVIEHIPDEQRIIVAYYSQGTKILDYYINGQGQFTFVERASVVFPGANTWAAEQFKMVNNANGTRTYYFMASDIARGMDVFSWTGPKNPIGAKPPAGAMTTSAPGSDFAGGNLGLLAAAVLLLPLAMMLGRRRRVVGRLGWAMLFRG
jgi:hypothetical protein